MSTIKYVLVNQCFVSAVVTARCDETYSATVTWHNSFEFLRRNFSDALVFRFYFV